MSKDKKAGNDTEQSGREKNSPNANGAVHLGSGGELHQVVGGHHPALTTNQDIPISGNQNALRPNARGAIAVILSHESARLLTKEFSSFDFVRNAFGHVKAIAVDKGGQELLKKEDLERGKR